MTTVFTPPTSIKTAPYKFTAPEKQRLSDAAAELARLDGLLEDLVRIKTVIDGAADDFASGKITTREAIGLLGCSGDSHKRAEIERKLRQPLKAALRATVGSVADLIDKARQHHVGELESKARELESNERGILDGLGVDQEDFQPSALLLGIREQWKRAKADAGQPPARDALNRLLAAL
jgi:hypothetical protein